MGAELKRTPLYQCHLKYGGKMVEFAGWELPVQFSGIIEEHKAVRTAAGLFDVSHMGEFDVRGEDAEALLQYALTADIATVAVGQAKYSLMCAPNGGVVDDVIAYRLEKDHFMVVVNAANSERDFRWLRDLATKSPGFRVELTDVSPSFAQLALQGPNAAAILGRLTGYDLSSIKNYWFARSVDISGSRALVARTGYTGEDGFEIFCKPEEAPMLWEAILEEGDELGCVPVGLGARDTLRFEACMPLYGHELTEETTPLEAGLSKFVALHKPDFVGRHALRRQSEEGLKRKLVGFEMREKGVPRAGQRILKSGEACGHVTSGSYAPFLGKFLGLGYVPVELAEVGNEIEVEIRGKGLKAKIVPTPFYKAQKVARVGKG